MTFGDNTLEVRGKNIEAAIEDGLAELGLDRNEVEIEIVRTGSRGVLGIGAEDAIVRLQRRQRQSAPAVVKAEPTLSPPPVQAQVEAAEETATVEIVAKPPAKIDRPRPQDAAPAAAADGLDEKALLAQDLLSTMLDLLDINGQVQTSYDEQEEGEEPSLVLNVVGQDLGILIGRRGDTLAALQFLLRLMVNNRSRQWMNLVVDVEGYKARRHRALKDLALRMAEQAASSGRVVALEAMSANERRLVHIALRNHPKVTTQSIGEDERRKVTIIPR